MAIDLSSIRRQGSDRAPLIVIHGPPGVGKTTFAASAPNPVFIRTEDGLGRLEVDTFPEAESIGDVMEAIASLYAQEHAYKTIVLDSLSALEPLIWRQVAVDHGADGIEGLGFGKGYVYAMEYWRELLVAFKGLCKRRITPIMIAHSEIVPFRSPDTDDYDRYQIKLHKRAFQLLYEQADIIGFAHEPVFVKKAEAKETKGKAKPKGERSLRLVEAPAVIAKNRYMMPDIIPLDWHTFASHVPYYTENHNG